MLKAISTVVLMVPLAACGPSSSTQAVQDKAPRAPVELSAGTALTVRLDQALSTVRNHPGDTFESVLDEPVVVAGTDVLPKGTTFTGHVTTATSAGRLKGRGMLGITLDAFELHGQHYAIVTSLDARMTEAHKKRNIELIGGGAGLGALVGGVTGGGKGAAIGAGIGAAGGTGVAAATGSRDVEVPAATVFRFYLKQPIEVVRSDHEVRSPVDGSSNNTRANARDQPENGSDR